jgi:hypothetical protein
VYESVEIETGYPAPYTGGTVDWEQPKQYPLLVENVVVPEFVRNATLSSAMSSIDIEAVLHTTPLVSELRPISNVDVTGVRVRTRVQVLG